VLCPINSNFKLNSGSFSSITISSKTLSNGFGTGKLMNPVLSKVSTFEPDIPDYTITSPLIMSLVALNFIQLSIY